MFDKIKLRKAPISLALVSNAIKTSGNADLLPQSLQPKQLDVYAAAQLGIPPNLIVAVAHDPVQLLLAVSTTQNEVRVYGQHNVQVVFEFKQPSPMTALMFVKGVYLVAVLAASGGVTVILLHSKQILGTFSPPGAILAVVSDPSLDWLVVGLANGLAVFYDVDRLALTPYRIDNLQKRILPKQKLLPVVQIEWHPRDIGTLLVCYSHSSLLYSMMAGAVVAQFVLEIRKGDRTHEVAQQGLGKRKLFGSLSLPVVPEVVASHMHPNGLHVATIHAGGLIAFWDAQDGTLLELRSVHHTRLHKPGDPVMLLDAPISASRWVCGADPEETHLVMALGNSVVVLDFGYTLKYSLTSHEKQGEFYAAAAVRTIPLTMYNDGEWIEQIVPIAAESPYFGGGCNPKYLVLVSNKGGFYMINFTESTSAAAGAVPLMPPPKPAFDPYSAPLGTLYQDFGNFSVDVAPQGSAPAAHVATAMLPPSLSLINPPVVCSQVVAVRKIDWFSVCPTRTNHAAAVDAPSLLRGGAPRENPKLPKPIGLDESSRNVLVTGHEGGVVRFFDVSRGEHADVESLLQVDLNGVLYGLQMRVVAVSCAFESKELLVAMQNGNVVICKYGKQKNGSNTSSAQTDYLDCPVLHTNGDASIVRISHRVLRSNAAASTFLPVALLRASGEVSCLQTNDVGFGAVAYKSGKLVVCDVTRGPAIILNVELVLQYLPSVKGVCYITTMEFMIAEYGNDGYSSVLLVAGTCAGGNLLMFKIVPQANGAFECVFVDKTLGLNYRALGGGNTDPEESRLTQLIPIAVKSGESTVAQLEIFHKLGRGVVIPSYIITASSRDIRVLKLPKQKLSHKVVDDTCLKAGLIRVRGGGVILAVLIKSGFIRFLTVPSLNEIADVKLTKETYLQVRTALESGAASGSDILPNGEIFLRTSQSECLLMTVFLQDSRLKKHTVEPMTDLLFNETAVIPLRPTAGLLQWVKGQTRYVSLKDLAHLIAGPNRKPEKREESRLAYNISPEANPNQGYGLNATTAAAKNPYEADYKAPVRGGAKTSAGGFNARGFMLSIQTGIDSIEESVHGYANGVTEAVTDSVEDSKKSMYGAAFKNKFGF